MSEQRVVWQALEEPGLEHLTLSRGRTGWKVGSTVVALQDGVPFTLMYQLRLDVHWHIQTAEFQILDGPNVRLRAHPEHQVWTKDHAGSSTPLPSLDGCDSLDITATPFTNTLPIQTLKLAVGESGVTRAAWVQVPSLEVRPAQQRYTRLGEECYLFESLESGFQAELTVDDAGLVVEYPGLFRRLI